MSNSPKDQIVIWPSQENIEKSSGVTNEPQQTQSTNNGVIMHTKPMVGYHLFNCLPPIRNYANRKSIIKKKTTRNNK